MSGTLTVYHVLAVDGSCVTGTVDWPPEPGYGAIKALVEPLLGPGEPMEHVSVLHEGRRRDMFVSELGLLNLTTRGPLPINRAATAIYRNTALTQFPGEDPETLPEIAGVAVLFERIIWT